MTLPNGILRPSDIVSTSNDEPDLLYYGVGVLHTGELCITTDDPVFFPNGIPTNAVGQVCVTSSPTLPVYFSGGLKFDATGRLVVTGTASSPAQYNSGFQFDTDGALVAVPGSLYSVSISGTPEVGQVLTAVLVGTGGSGFTYQWTRNGVDISGETASTYTVVTADQGTTIRVVVTYTVVATGLPETIVSGGVAIPSAASRFLMESSGFILLESGGYLLLEA